MQLYANICKYMQVFAIHTIICKYMQQYIAGEPATKVTRKGALSGRGKEESSREERFVQVRMAMAMIMMMMIIINILSSAKSSSSSTFYHQ